MTLVWIYVDASRARPWCVVVKASPGGRIVTGCSELPYREAMISTAEPDDLCCIACMERVSTGKREPAVPLAVDDLALARVTTVDIRGGQPVDPAVAWERPEWDPPSKEHTR